MRNDLKEMKNEQNESMSNNNNKNRNIKINKQIWELKNTLTELKNHVYWGSSCRLDQVAKRVHEQKQRSF